MCVTSPPCHHTESSSGMGGSLLLPSSTRVSWNCSSATAISHLLEGLAGLLPPAAPVVEEEDDQEEDGEEGGGAEDVEEGGGGLLHPSAILVYTGGVKCHIQPIPSFTLIYMNIS